jgi:hypothetical protein
MLSTPKSVVSTEYHSLILSFTMVVTEARIIGIQKRSKQTINIPPRSGWKSVSVFCGVFSKNDDGDCERLPLGSGCPVHHGILISKKRTSPNTDGREPK